MKNLPRRIALVTGGRRDWRSSVRDRQIAGVSKKFVDVGREGLVLLHQVLGAAVLSEDLKRTWTGGTRVSSPLVFRDVTVVGSPR
jgi:hypothetical protein